MAASRSTPTSLHWRWPVAAGFLVAAGACLILLWWAKDDYDQARSGSHVVHKWQYRVRIVYQQVLGPLLTGLTLLVAVWSVPHVYRFIVKQVGGALSAGLSSSLLGVIGAVYQFIAGRDKKSTSSAFSTLRILLTSVLLVYGILLVAYSIVQAGEDIRCTIVRHRRSAAGHHRLRGRVRRLHRERQLHRHRAHVSRPADGTVHARQGSHPRQPVATRRATPTSSTSRSSCDEERHVRSGRCTS